MEEQGMGNEDIFIRGEKKQMPQRIFLMFIYFEGEEGQRERERESQASSMLSKQSPM